MALIECKECKTKISTEAKTCPSCGAPAPKKTSLLTWLVVAVISLGFIGVITGNKDASNSAATPTPTGSTTVAAQSPQRNPGAAVAALAKTTDKIEKVTWYKDKSSPSTINANHVHAYIGEKDNTPWLRLAINFSSDEWLFIQKAIFVIDGEKAAEITGSWERNNDSTVYEWIDMQVGPTELALLKNIANAKKVTLRLEGRQFRKDRDLRPNEIKAITRVLAAFKELGGRGV